MADSGEQRARVAALIERQAEYAARSVLTPNVHLPWLIDVLRQVEQLKPWWESFQQGRIGVVRSPAASCDPVTDLDEVIRRLTELVRKWDSERNRLSIYATVYRRITEKVKALVNEGGFRDPDWMVRLDVLFANRYFDIICKYEEGRLDEIPRCWAFALETVRTGRTMIVQDIAVQIAPRVIFDLPITLVEAGLVDNLEARRHDYERTYDLFIEELDCIQELIARKYSRLERRNTDTHTFPLAPLGSGGSWGVWVGRQAPGSRSISLWWCVARGSHAETAAPKAQIRDETARVDLAKPGVRRRSGRRLRVQEAGLPWRGG